ncbi:MAG: hypothetical protein OSA99_17535 [Acidimicrobiales bacterium]|nr:hypothetical protein [Acidimicrobiales bacterium]
MRNHRPLPPSVDQPECTVEAIMARLVAGDPAAVFTLFEHHGHRVAGVVRRQLARCGVHDVAREDLQSLVLDACMELLQVAEAWRPGGALPWWWAEGRIRAVVIGWVGVHADSVDDHLDSIERGEEFHAATDEDEVAQTFARLVDEVPLVGLVAEAARVARVDELILHCMLDYRVQQDQGDPSPAHTLAPRYGVSPDALRQRVSRGRKRLRAVVDDDPRFAPIADFVLVA